VPDGVIGKPASARVQSSHAGLAARVWPADPTWFYQKGAGPLLDMGVYRIHRVTGVLGPAKAVAAMSVITAPRRRARGGAFDGLEIAVTEQDNNRLLLDFGGSTFAVVDATFNVTALLMRAALVDHLVECLASGQPPVAGTDHARHTLEIMLAARTGVQEADGPGTDRGCQLGAKHVDGDKRYSLLHRC
jgi:hypothetical protein